MNKFVTENLMLLEFLVDEIFFTAPTKKKIDSVHGETHVMFQFLDNKPIIITANELQASCAGSEKRCGKSCLFSMSTEQGVEALGHFQIKLNVFQKFPPGVLPNVIDIACGDICISELFQDLMESAMGSAEKAWVKCQKETIKLFMCGECVGSISVFIRMSCYGKYIVTHCEMNMGDFHDKKPKTCADNNHTQQSKCLPLPDTLVREAKDTKEKEKMPKRQIGAGEVMNEDPCNKIARQSDAPCLENQMQGDYVSPVKAQDLAFQMLDAPQWNGAQSQMPNNADFQNRYSAFADTATIPNSNFSQLQNQYPLPPPGTPRMSGPTFQGQIVPCDPCPPSAWVAEEIPCKEIEARPKQKRIVIPKPSKDKILVRLCMPKYGPKDDCDKPYEFEFVTPAGWPRTSLGKQCRDSQCDCRDFPKGYLEEYYGEDQLVEMLRNHMEEEMRREKAYGICPVGQFANVKRPKGGIAELFYKCLGVTALMNKKKKKVNGGGGKKKGGGEKKIVVEKETDDGEKEDTGKKKGGGGGGKKKKTGGGGKKKKEHHAKPEPEPEPSIVSEPPKPKKNFFTPKRKLHKHGGIEVPEKRPVCGPCMPCAICPASGPGLPCGPCGGGPCGGPCDGPCGGPCSGPCGSTCGRGPCGSYKSCSACPSSVGSKLGSTNMSPCASRCPNLL